MGERKYVPQTSVPVETDNVKDGKDNVVVPMVRVTLIQGVQLLWYSPDATSHSQASAREQALEVVRVYALLISSVHLLYFECTFHCRVSTRHEVTRE